MFMAAENSVLLAMPGWGAGCGACGGGLSSTSAEGVQGSLIGRDECSACQSASWLEVSQTLWTSGCMPAEV